MKNIELELTVQLEAHRAFTTARDHLPKIITEPNPVSHIDQELSQIGDNKLLRKDHWEGNVLNPLPDPISHRLPFDKILIQSRSQWDQTELEVDWEVQIARTDDFLNYCGGTIRFRGSNDESIIRMDGQFDVDVSDVPGIPKVLADQLERFQVPLARKVLNPYLPILAEKLKDIS